MKSITDFYHVARFLSDNTGAKIFFGHGFINLKHDSFQISIYQLKKFPVMNSKLILKAIFDEEDTHGDEWIGIDVEYIKNEQPTFQFYIVSVDFKHQERLFQRVVDDVMMWMMTRDWID